MEENLTRENFWDALYAQYPKGVNVFCEWVDEYKKKYNWDTLFKGDIRSIAVTGTSVTCEYDTLKYHDLPLAMQIGIWIEFVCDRGGCAWEIDDMFTYNWKEDITEYCKMLQEEVTLQEKL